MTRTRISAFAVALSTVVAGGIAATPAQAVTCAIARYSSAAADYARTTDVTGGCASVSVRHAYDPVWSSSNYWTKWYTGKNVAQTPATAELYASGHSYIG